MMMIRPPAILVDSTEEGAAPEIRAQWALWGMVGNKSGHHVLRCSKGVFGRRDFDEIIARYASGANEALPQYTACWIPAGEEEHGGYLAVGIHELADPGRSGGRARSAAGREIEYIRLFCVRYAELAQHGVGYTDLVEAVRDQQLPAGSTDPITVRLPDNAQPHFCAPLQELAENVAALLLTTRPVCVLGADAATAEDRLLFIESVMALLPYGLRSTMSASTWASATAQDLKLRLFFSNARRDDAGRTINVTWSQPAHLDLPATEQAPKLYLSWLRQASPGVVAALFASTEPIRFDPGEVSAMVARLSEDRPVGDTLSRLANSLRHGDQAAVAAELHRIKQDLVRMPGPVERLQYRRVIVNFGLLRDHGWLHPGLKASLYRVLLHLAFERNLSYASYCQVEDAIGGTPTGTLRSVLLKGGFLTFVPWLLVAKGDPDNTDGTLMESLAEQHVPATAVVTVLERGAGKMRPEHRATVCGFAVRYLIAHAEEPRAELVRRGYLADVLEAVYPGDETVQRIRLQAMLRFVHGDSLSRDQIGELFANPKLRPTKAFEAAVSSMAPHPADRFIQHQAALARLRQAGHADDASKLQRGTQRRSRRRVPDLISVHDPDAMGTFPKTTV